MKQSQADHIKQLATEAAKTVLQDTAVAKSALDTQTSMNIKQIQSDISEMKEILKTNMLSKEEFHPVQEQAADHETRIRIMEKWMWMAIGIVGFAEVVIGLYVYAHK